MNYLKLLNSFNELVEKNPLPALSQIVWYKLISLFNVYGWSEWVSVDNRRLMWVSQINNDKTFISYRNKLIDRGFIEYKKGKKGNPSQYKLIDLTVINTVQITAHSTVEVTVNSTVNPTVKVTDINKLKTKNKNKESNLSTSLRSVEKLPKKFASKNFVNNEFENVLSKSDHDEFENAQFVTKKPVNHEKCKHSELKNALPKPVCDKLENAQSVDEKSVDSGKCNHGKSKNTQFVDEKPANHEKCQHDELENTQFANEKPANPEKHKHDEFVNAQFANEKPTNPEKHKHGEFQNVLLTSEEFTKLETEYSKDLPGIIEHLSSYIEMKGYKAKSHYLAIRKWVALAYREQKLHEAELAKREENLKQHKNYGGNSNYGENSDGNYESEVAKRARCTEFAHIKSTDGSDLSDTECEELRRECEEIHRSELEKWEREQAERKNFKPGPWRL